MATVHPCLQIPDDQRQRGVEVALQRGEFTWKQRTQLRCRPKHFLVKPTGENARLVRERDGGEAHTLQPTALVHEAYLRIAGDQQNQQWDRRGHFFAAAALAMRRILVERARHYQRLRHGSGGQRVRPRLADRRRQRELDRPGRT
jgi:hypothetical protein